MNNLIVSAAHERTETTIHPITQIETTEVAGHSGPRSTGWVRALWEALATGPATPIPLAMAGPNGLPLWPGLARAVDDGLPARTVLDVHADHDWIAPTQSSWTEAQRAAA